MALVFLLASETQASSGPKSCVGVVSAWMATDPVTLVQDSQFISNFAECINEIKGLLGSELHGKLKAIIQQLPKLFEKVLPVAREGGLVLLSAYVLYKSFELYDRAMNLEKDYTMHREEFEALKEEMKPFKDFIATQLIPLWEKGNNANLQKITNDLLDMMSRQLTVLRELIQTIHRDSKKAGSDNRWSVFYSVAAVASCVGSIAVGNVPVIVVTCGAGGGTIAFIIMSCIHRSETLAKLDILGKDVMTMRKEITKYKSDLVVARMAGEL